MNDLDAFPAEDPIQVEVVGVQDPAHFPGPVVVYPRPPGAVPGIGDIDLVAVTPRPPLLHFPALVVHVPLSQVVLDDPGHRAVLDKGRQDLYRKPEIGRNAGHVRFSAGHVQSERVAAVHGLAAGRRDAKSHARGDQQAEGAVGP